MMRFLHLNLLPIWLALALVAAVICWFGVPQPVATASGTPPAQDWALPKLPDNQSRKSIEAINARNLWGFVAADAPKPPVWTIQGIARSGNDRFILMALEGKPAEILKVGDTLPDGAKIVQIDNDRFFVQGADKKKIAFGIYKDEPQK